MGRGVQAIAEKLDLREETAEVKQGGLMKEHIIWGMKAVGALDCKTENLSFLIWKNNISNILYIKVSDIYCAFIHLFISQTYWSFAVCQVPGKAL